MAVIQRWPPHRGWWCVRIVLVDGLWDLSHILAGIIIEGNLPNQVAVSTGSTVVPCMCMTLFPVL